MNNYLVYLASYYTLLCTVLNAMQDDPTAASLYKYAQYAEAQVAYTHGYAYYTHPKNEQEKQDGLRLLTRAAQLGYIQAQLFLGNYYYSIIGNRDRAETWYKRAADAHNAQACYGYACIARDKRNFGIAATYFRKAALLGCKYAFSELGVLYLKGKGVSAQDYHTAYELFRVGALHGDDIARVNSIVQFAKTKDQADALEKMLTTSDYPVVKEYCYKTLDELVYKGDIAACLHQAYNYAHKSAHEQDVTKAQEYIQRAEHMLGSPKLFSKKLIKRTKLYQTLMRLVELKSCYACWFLSELLAYDDPAKAHRYKKQAFEYGSLPDGLELALCYKSSSCTPQEKEEALYYYRTLLVKAHEQNQRALLDTHKAELEELSTTYVEAHAQLLLLALWGLCPELTNIQESIAYFWRIHDHEYGVHKHTFMVRLLHEIEELARQDIQGRCACLLASVYLTPGIYYAPEKGVAYLESALEYAPQDALDVLIECINNSSRAIPYTSRIITSIRTLSAQGNWQADYIMGVWLFFGYPIESDSEQAIVLLTHVQNQIPAYRATYYWLGVIQLSKIYDQAHDILVVQEHVEQALRLLYKAAEKKFAAALFTLGKIYQEGISHNKQVIIAQDYARATWYFKQLALLNHPEGMQYLGLAYYYGKGIEKNNKKACELLQKAYIAGVDDALDELALVFCNKEQSTKKLTNKQCTEILTLLESIALQHGHSKYIQANAYLIKIYCEEIFVKKDSIKAAECALHVLQQTPLTQCERSPEFQVAIMLLSNTLTTQAQKGDMQARIMLVELNRLYFKLDFERFVQEAQDSNVHIRLKGLAGLMACYMHGRGVDVNLAKAVSYALEILRAPAYTESLQVMLETMQQVEQAGITVTSTSFAKIFLSSINQLVNKLKESQLTDKSMLALYKLLRTVVHESPLKNLSKLIA